MRIGLRLGISLGIFLSLFICSIQRKAKRVIGEEREDLNIYRMVGSAILGKLVRKRLCAEVTLEQRADQGKNKPCDSLQNITSCLGNGKYKVPETLVRECAWSSQRTATSPGRSGEMKGNSVGS